MYFIGLLIMVSLVTLLTGGFLLVNYGFASYFNIILSVFLQEPEEAGGYGFTPVRRAYCELLCSADRVECLMSTVIFSLWFGTIVAQIYGNLANDRIPLWLCHRRGGEWKPEYRFHALWLPSIILPVALGLFGCALYYRLHYMIPAVACFLGTWATAAMNPITATYHIESFKDHSSSAAAVVGLYRLALLLTLPFFEPQ